MTQKARRNNPPPSKAELEYIKEYALILIDSETLPEQYIWEKKPSINSETGEIIPGHEGKQYPKKKQIAMLLRVLLRAYELGVDYGIAPEKMFFVRGNIGMQADLAYYLIQRDAHADIRFEQVHVIKGVVLYHARPIGMDDKGFYIYPKFPEGYQRVEFTIDEALMSGKWLRHKQLDDYPEKKRYSISRSPWWCYPLRMLVWKAIDKMAAQSYQLEVMGIRVAIPELAGDINTAPLPLPPGQNENVDALMPPEEASEFEAGHLIGMVDDSEEPKLISQGNEINMLKEKSTRKKKTTKAEAVKQAKEQIQKKPKRPPPMPILDVKDGKKVMKVKPVKAKKEDPKENEQKTEIIKPKLKLKPKSTKKKSKKTSKKKSTKKPTLKPKSSKKKSTKSKLKPKSTKKKTAAPKKRFSFRGDDEFACTSNIDQQDDDYPLAALSSIIQYQAKTSDNAFTFKEIQKKYQDYLLENEQRNKAEPVCTTLLDAFDAIMTLKGSKIKVQPDVEGMWINRMNKKISGIIGLIDSNLINSSNPRAEKKQVMGLIKGTTTWEDQRVDWIIDLLVKRGLYKDEGEYLKLGEIPAEVLNG